jgi:disulfide bond formation protein DsbB
MVVTTRRFAGFILTASVLVLGAALLSQYVGGLFPCELCLLQRWPWWMAIALSGIAWLFGARLGRSGIAWALVLVFVISAGLAFYHVGVEQHWFAGPTACTAARNNATSVEELRRQLLATQPVLCDRVQWSLFGVSLAGLNLIASLALLALCLVAATRTRSAA